MTKRYTSVLVIFLYYSYVKYQWFWFICTVVFCIFTFHFSTEFLTLTFKKNLKLFVLSIPSVVRCVMPRNQADKMNDNSSCIFICNLISHIISLHLLSYSTTHAQILITIAVTTYYSQSPFFFSLFKLLLYLSL